MYAIAASTSAKGPRRRPSSLANDTSAALAITWDKERASTIHICFGTETGPCRWRTASGIRLGLPLMELQKINGKSFQLAGYGFEGQGAVTSWRHGALEEDPAACGHLVVRLSPAAELEGRPMSKQESSFAEAIAGRQAVLIRTSVDTGTESDGLRIRASVHLVRDVRRSRTCQSSQQFQRRRAAREPLFCLRSVS